MMMVHTLILRFAKMEKLINSLNLSTPIFRTLQYIYVYIYTLQIKAVYRCFIFTLNEFNIELVRYMLPTALKYPRGIEMVSVCIGLLGEEGRVSTSVDTRL